MRSLWRGRSATSTTAVRGGCGGRLPTSGGPSATATSCMPRLISGATTVLYEGKPVGTPDAGAFWRVIAEHGVDVLFTAPTAIRAIKKEDPYGELLRKHDVSSLQTLFLAGERLDPETYNWATKTLNVPVVDNWWQTETGWPIAANLRGLEPMEIKPGSPSVPVPGYDVVMLGREGAAGVHRTGMGDLHPAPDAAGHAADAVAGRPALPVRRRGLPGRGRIPVRYGSHRRRHQRGRAPALHWIDGGRHDSAPRPWRSALSSMPRTP